MFSSSDSSFMSLAIQEAEKAFASNEVPVGAIIVQEIGRASCRERV